MEVEVLGWPPDGPQLRLDHERFAYAGKFVMTDTGKAVGREDGETVAAVSFSPDRTDPATLRIRYVTVRDDRRGEGLGPQLADVLVTRAFDRGFDAAKIAVNNPYAYEAMYRAGFAFTREETGMAELVLARTGDDSAGSGHAPQDEDGDEDATYEAGLRMFARRDLGADERDFVAARLDGEPAARDGTPRDP